VSSDLPEPPLSAFSGSPAREVLDWLYRFVAVIERSPSVAVHSQDRSGIVRFWNQACAALTGISAGEAIGQPFVKLVRHIGQQDEFEEVLASVWRTGEAIKAREWHVELRDGRRLWLHSSHFPVPGNGTGHDEVRQVFCMEVDVTARKELEDSLRQAGQVFDHARDAILLVDREHRVLAANRAYPELTAILATVNSLRERGVNLTIDNFGTGFSSLSSLRRFPLSKLKIDRSFIDDIVSEPDGVAMIPAIIALARSLKLKVIAEGVETAEQLAYLQQHGCDEYQGFYSGGAVGRSVTPPSP
jgi:PAS domain S-box-containing protein